MTDITFREAGDPEAYLLDSGFIKLIIDKADVLFLVGILLRENPTGGAIYVTPSAPGLLSNQRVVYMSAAYVSHIVTSFLNMKRATKTMTEVNDA
jgi:hypothetical protein